MSGGTLYVVATPLGHLQDLSPRAADVLRAVGVVAAEDTRRTRALLTHIGARPRMVSVHAHVRPERLAAVVRELEQGTDVALVTDAGTPGISDPGGTLVELAQAQGIAVRSVPGPSAVTAALSISGLSADRYVFVGFLPRRGAERRDLLERVAGSEWTVAAFEAANRLVGTLEDLAGACGGDRVAVVARELTKLHEESRRGTLDELVGHYREHPPRGEVTLVVAGRAPAGEAAAEAPDEAAVRARARELLAGRLSRRDAAARIAAEFGMSRNEAYAMVTAL